MPDFKKSFYEVPVDKRQKEAGWVQKLIGTMVGLISYLSHDWHRFNVPLIGISLKYQKKPNVFGKTDFSF